MKSFKNNCIYHVKKSGLKREDTDVNKEALKKYNELQN